MIFYLIFESAISNPAHVTWIHHASRRRHSAELFLKAQRGIVDALEDAPVHVIKDNATALHHPARNCHECFYRHVGEAAFGTTDRKTRNERAGISAAMKVDADTDNRRGVEHTVDSGLGMISHYQSAELKVGPHEGLRGIVPDTYP